MSSPPVSSSTREALQRLSLELKSNSENWKPRMSALSELESVVTDELKILGMEGEESLSPLLFSLSTSLITQITDLRSELVKQAAHTLSYLAENYPNAFTKTACKVVPPLLHVASGTNGVIRGHTDPAIKSIVRSCPHVNICNDCIAEFKSTKSKQMKQVILELLEIMLHNWSTKVFKKLAKDIEDAIIGGLGSAESASRQIAASCALYLNDHFPSRFKAFMQSLDSRSQKIVVEFEKEKGHQVALNAVPEEAEKDTRRAGLVRRDSLGGATASASSKSPTHSNSSVPVSSPSDSMPPLSSTDVVLVLDSSESLVTLDKATIAIGSRVEVIDPLDLDDVPDDQADENYREYIGRKGTVVTVGEIEDLLGEWIGVELEAEEMKDGNSDAIDSGGLVNLRRRCLAHLAEPKKKPKIDAAAKSTSAGVESPSSTKSAKNFKTKTPTTSAIPKSSPPQKARVPASTVAATPSTAASPMVSRIKPPMSASLNSPSAMKTAVRTPTSTPTKPAAIKSKIPTPNRSREASPSRDKEDPNAVSNPKPPLLRPTSAPQYGASRIPGPSTVNFHSLVGATPKRTIAGGTVNSPNANVNSTAATNNGNHSSTSDNKDNKDSNITSITNSNPSSPRSAVAPSLASAEWSEYDAEAAAAGRDRLVSVPEPRDLPGLVKDHRSHVTDSALNLQQLNALLNSCHSNPHYVDNMIKLLGEHLQKTTFLLQGFVKLKRRTINAAKIRVEHDDFLDKMDNFKAENSENREKEKEKEKSQEQKIETQTGT